MKRYSAIVYRDDHENQEAARWWSGIGDEFTSPAKARDAIRRVIAEGHWEYGDVHEGEFTPAVFGVSPAHFDSDLDSTPWLVGPDWYERG